MKTYVVASALLMSTHDICFRAEKYQYFLDENVPYLELCYLFSGPRLGNRTSGERNNRQHLQLHRSCLLNLLPTCLRVRHPELNESTDIDVDQSIEDIVSQTISSSTEIPTIFFFFFFFFLFLYIYIYIYMKDDLILTVLYPVGRRPPVHKHFHQKLCITTCSALNRE